MGTNQFRLLWVALLSLSGVLPTAATDYQAADYLPLAVGNSWTYKHEYYDQGLGALYDNGTVLYPAYYQWPTLDESSQLPIFTITVEGTEVIDGKTYYVLSDMPTGWPPAPPHFIAGKKLRWEGTHLMEHTTDGERFVFRFDGANDAGYTISTSGLDLTYYADGSAIKGGESVLTYGGENLVKVGVYSNPNDYLFSFYGTEPGIRQCLFTENLGCYGCTWGGIYWDHQRVFLNSVSLLYAVLGGRLVKYEDLLTPTSISPSSWGQVKEEMQ